MLIKLGGLINVDLIKNNSLLFDPLRRKMKISAGSIVNSTVGIPYRTKSVCEPFYIHMLPQILICS